MERDETDFVVGRIVVSALVCLVVVLATLKFLDGRIGRDAPLVAAYVLIGHAWTAALVYHAVSVEVRVWWLALLANVIFATLPVLLLAFVFGGDARHAWSAEGRMFGAAFAAGAASFTLLTIRARRSIPQV